MCWSLVVCRRLPPLDIRVPDDFGGEEWESRWEGYVACGAAVPEAESRDAWMHYVKELHTRFEGYECCIDASVARTAAHEDLKSREAQKETKR